MVGQSLGWVGAICFTLCAIPQVMQCARQGNTEGLSSLFLLLWFIGEASFIAAILLEYGLVPWLLGNYMANFLCLLVIGRYYFWPVCKKE